MTAKPSEKLKLVGKNWIRGIFAANGKETVKEPLSKSDVVKGPDTVVNGFPVYV